MLEWPDWWSWVLAFSPHLLRRMLDRRFSEADLRIMLQDASGYHWDYEPGRWIIETRHQRRDWHVIVEPLPAEKLLLVVTAYPIE
jgi:hypothetical protein